LASLVEETPRKQGELTTMRCRKTTQLDSNEIYSSHFKLGQQLEEAEREVAALEAQLAELMSYCQKLLTSIRDAPQLARSMQQIGDFLLDNYELPRMSTMTPMPEFRETTTQAYSEIADRDTED
jgi:hypothetical protein